ncbi:Uncharacterized protein Adt_27248 [Abeliophyllum distichum]|uniref:Putative plant transposon protein domain-containing protein n=1 Tax=Abeliophyllum distichum TaxID=126358 RepID=A0ABD1RT69_9LAMI
MEPKQKVATQERGKDKCGWSKVAAAPHPAYITLVREFFAKFNKEIDTPESSRRHKTWVRGKWIRFCPIIIDQYYELNHTGIDPMPTEEDMQSVTWFLYGRENAWPLATSHFKHDELTREIRALHIFVCTNINPTTQCTSGICLEAGVPLLPFEEADNSEARIRAREIRARRAPAVQPDEAAHDPAHLVP